MPNSMAGRSPISIKQNENSFGKLYLNFAQNYPRCLHGHDTKFTKNEMIACNYSNNNLPFQIQSGWRNARSAWNDEDIHIIGISL